MDLARELYQAYVGDTETPEGMPRWSDLAEPIRQHWRAVAARARAVLVPPPAPIVVGEKE